EAQGLRPEPPSFVCGPRESGSPPAHRTPLLRRRSTDALPARCAGPHSPHRHYQPRPKQRQSLLSTSARSSLGPVHIWCENQPSRECPLLGTAQHRRSSPWEDRVRGRGGYVLLRVLS